MMIFHNDVIAGHLADCRVYAGDHLVYCWIAGGWRKAIAGEKTEGVAVRRIDDNSAFIRIVMPDAVASSDEPFVYTI